MTIHTPPPHPSRCDSVAQYVDLFQCLATAIFKRTGSLVLFGRFPQFLGDSENKYFREYLRLRAESAEGIAAEPLRRRRARLSQFVAVWIQAFALRLLGSRTMIARAQRVPPGAVLVKPHMPGRILRASLFPAEFSLARSPRAGQSEILAACRGHLVQLPTCRNWVFLLHNLLTLGACLLLPRNRQVIIVDALAQSRLPSWGALVKAQEAVLEAGLSASFQREDTGFVQLALKKVGVATIACDLMLQDAYEALFNRYLREATVYQTNAINKEDRIMTYFAHEYGHNVIFRSSRVITRCRSSVVVRPEMDSKFLPDRYEVADHFSAGELESMGVSATVIESNEKFGRAVAYEALLGVALQAPDDGNKEILSFASALARHLGETSLIVQPHPHFELHGLRLWLRRRARRDGITIAIGDATRQAAVVLTAYSSEGLRAHDAGRLVLWVPSLAERSWVMAPIMDQVGHRAQSVPEAAAFISEWVPGADHYS